MSVLNPYLNFRGRSREALEFYRSAFGGDLTISTFGDFGADVAEADRDLVMHGQLETPAGFTLMASDPTQDMTVPDDSNIAVSVSGQEESELRGYWDALADGATIVQPLETAPWGASFGMLVDRFGIRWLVNITPAG